MIELQDKELMLARGQYSTLGAEQRDAVKQLQMLCGHLSSVSSQILHGVQPKDDEPINVADAIDIGKQLLNKIERITMRLTELAEQRAELKPRAWGNKR
jgi:hypothetical protein